MTNQASVAYAEPSPSAGVWLAGDGLWPEGEGRVKQAIGPGSYGVDPGVLQVAATVGSTERFSVKPPAPSALAVMVDERTAEAALQDVLAALGAASAAMSTVHGNTAGEEKLPTVLQPTLRTLDSVTSSLMDFYKGAVSMEALQMKLFDLQSSGLLDLMSLSFMHQKTLRTVEVNLLNRKAEAENQARDKEAKLNEKAGKGAVLGLVINWAMGAAQIAVGAVKLAAGQPQGALDIAAGVAGVTKSILMTVVHCHPELREQLQDDIDRCAKAELALGIISGVASLASGARIVQAGRTIFKEATSAVLHQGTASLGMTMTRAVATAETAAQAAKSAVAPAAAKLALQESQSAMSAAQQIANTIGKEVAKGTAEKLQVVQGFLKSSRQGQRFTQMFGEEAIQKMVSDALMRAAKNVAGKGLQDCVGVIKTEFAKQVERELIRGLGRAVVSQQALFRAAVTAVGAATSGAVPLVNGVMTVEFASHQRDINTLLLEAIVLGFAIDNMQRAAKAEEEYREGLMDELNVATSNASKGIREAGESMQQVVGNMA
jgi:secreted effector protein SseC